MKPLDQRDRVLDRLLGEIQRPPCFSGDGLEFTYEQLLSPLDLDQENDFGKSIYVKDSGLQVVRGMQPHFRFGTGVLHSPIASSSSDEVEIDPEELIESDSRPEVPRIHTGSNEVDGAFEEFKIDETLGTKPKALGASFALPLQEHGSINFKFSATLFSRGKVKWSPTDSRKARSEVIFVPRVAAANARLAMKDIFDKTEGAFFNINLDGELGQNLKLQAMINRKGSEVGLHGEPLVSVTIVFINTGPENFYDAGAELTVDGSHFCSNSFYRIDKTPDLEQQELEYLHRHKPSFGVGHGTGLTWKEDSSLEGVFVLNLGSSPTYSLEKLTLEIPDLELSMRELSATNHRRTIEALQNLRDRYAHWLNVSKVDDSQSGGEYRDIFLRLVSKADAILERMDKSIELLAVDPNAFEAFRLMNLAMLMQQEKSKLKIRSLQAVSPLKISPADPVQNEKLGKWRPFQAGFLLLSLYGLAQENEEDRDIVDLIFFPTGGGKTEAYLGAASFLMFLMRLRDQSHSGVDVLMRYTLRLLTAQQFERAASLIVSMELLRRQNAALGSKPFSIGIWVGGGTTGNSRDDLISQFKALGDARESEASGSFLLTKCPNCAAPIGKVKGFPFPMGLAIRKSPAKAKTVMFVCSDLNCEFSDGSKYPGLPIWISDEDVYDEMPSFIVATVDKFALTSFYPERRNLFGLGVDGNRLHKPPSLIIQDELHLIEGPLGSMTGLYEPVLEDLCTEKSSGKTVRPKIIASTATARRYEQQCLSLYGRKKVQMFPVAVDRAGETFFSSIERDESGSVRTTKFVGVYAPTFGSSQTAAVRVAAALLQAPVGSGNDSTADGYFTQLWFFNSIRELAQTSSLIESDVGDHINGMRNSSRIQRNHTRWPRSVWELTSRMDTSQVTSIMANLGVSNGERESIDICLASSIIEVGVDVSRLGLLVISNQPKSTSQYIQVSGRVGRDFERAPGLVVVLYNAQRPRDVSVFEDFQSYHSRLYAQVEPVSVTPFTPQAIDRGLLGAVMAHQRMIRPKDDMPKFNSKFWSVTESLFLDRAGKMNGADIDYLQQSLDEIAEWWKTMDVAKWGYFKKLQRSEDPKVLRLLRASIPPLFVGDDSKIIPSSLRGVDAMVTLQTAHPWQRREQETP